MTSLLFAMVASFLAALGARDQLTVAALRAALGPSPVLLAIGLASAAATAALAAWFGTVLGQDLSNDAARMFMAIVCMVSAIECAWPSRFRPPAEPTRSFGAVALVLFMRQLSDAARFLVVGFAAFFAAPQLAAIGGALGGGAAVVLGYALGGDLERRVPVRALRRTYAGVLFLAACILGLTARGII